MSIKDNLYRWANQQYELIASTTDRVVALRNSIDAANESSIAAEMAVNGQITPESVKAWLSAFIEAQSGVEAAAIGDAVLQLQAQIGRDEWVIALATNAETVPDNLARQDFITEYTTRADRAKEQIAQIEKARQFRAGYIEILRGVVAGMGLDEFSAWIE